MRRTRLNSRAGISALALGASLLLAVACGGSEGTPATSSTSTATVAAADSTQIATVTTESTASTGNQDAEEAILSSLMSVAEVKSFRFTVISEGETGPVEQTGSVVLPDRMHFVDPSNEIIVIGTTMYQKPAGEEWMKLDGLGSQMLEDGSFMLSDPEDADEFRQAANDATFLRTEDFEGTPTRVYRYTSDFGESSGIKLSSVQTVWIGADDNLPRKIESEGKSESGGQTFTSLSTVLYHDYDADFTIEAPIP